MKNLYPVLGVSPDADAETLRSAYLERAKQYHPDRPTGDEARFKEVQAAYDILGDAVRRRAYDQARAAWLSEYGAVDCSQCGQANRVPRLPGRATSCGRCRAPLTEENSLGRIQTKFLDETSALAAELSEAIVGEATALAQDGVRSGFRWIRRRLGLPSVASQRMAQPNLRPSAPKGKE